MRPLAAVPADPAALIPLLRDALSGTGPAILPYPIDAPRPEVVPAEVPSRIALVIETSGSAGVPKRVALSTDALLAAAAATEAALGGPGTWILSLPAHYIAGVQVLIRSIAAGREPIVLDPSFAPADFAAALSAISGDRRYGAVVPAQLARLIDAAEVDPGLAGALRTADGVLVGGQRTPESLMTRAASAGLTVIRTYGSSETAGGVVYDGAPIGSTEPRIEDGEVWLSSPSLAEGYLEDPERTARSFVTEAGRRWYRTGDEGEIVDGVLSVHGRRDDVIISGGEKVSLGLVEKTVREEPGLEGSVVVSTPDERWGEVPVVVSSRRVDVAELRAVVATELGRAASPAGVHVLDPLPTLPSGKPDRRAISQLVRNRPVVLVSAVLVTDTAGRALLVRKGGTTLYMQPGGKPEPGESALDAAARELAEEVGIAVTAHQLEPLGRFRAAAANESGYDVVADSFALTVAETAVVPLAEIDDALWVTRTEAAELPLAPLTRDHFLSRLKA